MAIQTCESFVLRKIPFRETSWIATFLTPDFGKIKGVVKGARKEKSRWASTCELLTHSKMIFFEKTRTNLHLVTDLSILESHEKLRSHFPALTYASYFAELLDQLLEEHHPQPAVFDLLKTTLDLLEENPGRFEIFARLFEIKLLEALGILPRFGECLECGSQPGRRVFFSAKQGGILCDRCYQKRRSGFLISPGCLQAIRFISKSAPERTTRIRLGPQIKKELSQVLRQFIDYRTDRHIKSYRFINQVQSVLNKNML